MYSYLFGISGNMFAATVINNPHFFDHSEEVVAIASKIIASKQADDALFDVASLSLFSYDIRARPSLVPALAADVIPSWKSALVYSGFLSICILAPTTVRPVVIFSTSCAT